MLTRIVEFSVRRPGLVIGLACALLIYGIVVASRTRYDVFPEFAPPQVEIQTEAPGLDPEQVEVLVTTPIEQSITGTSGVAIVRCRSKCIASHSGLTSIAIAKRTSVTPPTTTVIQTGNRRAGSGVIGSVDIANPGSPISSR